MPNANARTAWLAHLTATAPSNRPEAEAAVRRLYAAGGFPVPQRILWFDSPCAAAWSIATLVAEGSRVWAPLIAQSALSRTDRERVDRARSELAALLGQPDWNSTVRAVGHPRIGALTLMPNPSRLFISAITEARFALTDDVTALFSLPGDQDDLARAESYLCGGNLGVLTSALHCGAAGGIIGDSFLSEYTISKMADDEARQQERHPPPILSAAWDIARSSGMFWPFEHAAFVSDRPAELRFNDRWLLHREDGPAAVYRDGWRVFAWNGKAVPERWIMEPEAVPPREYKGFDATFAKFAASRGKPSAKPSRRPKAGSILHVTLSPDHATRLEQLRSHAGGHLPLLKRYQAGECRPVWQELVSLGASVREDPVAPDALAVAYETMRRVDDNVRSLVMRLSQMGYRFTTGRQPGWSLAGIFRKTENAHARAHVPPPADAARRVAEFEKEYGTLPLSLRAFHEVVGEVNLSGTHRVLDPSDHPVAPDPLLVYGLDEGIVEFDDDDAEDDEGAPSAVTIAPDDLHKAGTSGGDPYQMAIPDARADGELLNERHQLFFVDYLRLAFQYGGFPGYEGRARVPDALKTLSAGLLEF
ncbi:MAG TPA: hypothetical protein VFZ73_18010 [Gemmatimonadaceae bacterium]